MSRPPAGLLCATLDAVQSAMKQRALELRQSTLADENLTLSKGIETTTQRNVAWRQRAEDAEAELRGWHGRVRDAPLWPAHTACVQRCLLRVPLPRC